MPIEVRDDRAAFESYLSHNAGASVYHRCEWDAAYATYGMRIERLVATRAGTPVGIVPLVRQSSLLFGKRVISLPWVDNAGIVASDDEVEMCLLNAIADASKGMGSRCRVILKQPTPLASSEQCLASNCWQSLATGKVLVRRALDEDADVLWKDLSPKVRNQVRKAEKKGLVAERGGAELVAEFFDVYATNMRDLASPSHSLAFFRAVVTEFAEDACITLVRHEGRAIGGGLTLCNGEAMELPWASSLREFNSYCVNHLLYWTVLREACNAGRRWFNFGRSTVDSGQFRFKKQWGAEEVPLHWYEISAGDQQEASPFPGQSERFGLAQTLWRRLPVSAARAIGPRLIRRLP